MCKATYSDNRGYLIPSDNTDWLHDSQHGHPGQPDECLQFLKTCGNIPLPLQGTPVLEESAKGKPEYTAQKQAVFQI